MSRAAAFEVDGCERARPISPPRAVVKNRLTGPGRGSACVGAHRVLERRPVITRATRLHMQAAQAEPVSFVVIEHGVVGGDSSRSVARELRRLRLQELGHRLVPDQPARVCSVLGGGSSVACADSEHAARQRLKPLLTPARPRADRNQRRDAEDEAQDGPHDRDRDRERENRGKREHERDLVFLAPPGDIHDARIVREPREAPRGQR